MSSLDISSNTFAISSIANAFNIVSADNVTALVKLDGNKASNRKNPFFVGIIFIAYAHTNIHTININILAKFTIKNGFKFNKNPINIPIACGKYIIGEYTLVPVFAFIFVLSFSFNPIDIFSGISCIFIEASLLFDFDNSKKDFGKSFSIYVPSSFCGVVICPVATSNTLYVCATSSEPLYIGAIIR